MRNYSGLNDITRETRWNREMISSWNWRSTSGKKQNQTSCGQLFVARDPDDRPDSPSCLGNSWSRGDLIVGAWMHWIASGERNKEKRFFFKIEENALMKIEYLHTSAVSVFSVVADQRVRHPHTKHTGFCGCVLEGGCIHRKIPRGATDKASTRTDGITAWLEPIIPLGSRGHCKPQGHEDRRRENYW